MKYLALPELSEHPKNVRAKAEYSEASIVGLAASIETHGLLQSLVVQHMEDGTYGVLAGRRRLLAIRMLDDGNRLDARFKVPCKVIGKDVDHITAVSLAENTMQEPMAPLDEFEAFAAMTEEGATAETIAAAFGTTIRAVKERLRYGLVHRDIRAAARDGKISLDTMKAYACHPCTETQARVFEGFAENPSDHQSWRVRDVLNEQDLRADDPLAVFILERYQEAGGAIITGLFEEDTVLIDRALAERLRDEELGERAEELREQHGFSWAEIRPRFDYAELAGFGRIYPKLRDMNETEAASFNANALRLDELAIEIEGFDDVDALSTEDEASVAALAAEYDRLELENDRLREAFDPDEAARAGVIACLSHGGIRFELGLIRPEDSLSGGGLSDDGLSSSDQTTAQPAKPVISASLKQDLGWERAELVAAALAKDQWLARDAMVFQLVTQVFASRGFVQGAIAIRMTGLSGTHSRPEAKLPDAGERLQASHDALELAFLDDEMTEAEQFAAFRALGSQEKWRILARIVAMQIEPQLWNARKANSFTEALYGEAILNLRSVWRPTAANYWSRVSKGHILDTLHALGLDDLAREYAAQKKAALAEKMEALFAEPPSSLSDKQRLALKSWAPDGMQAQPAVDANTLEEKGGASVVGATEDETLLGDGGGSDPEPEIEAA